VVGKGTSRLAFKLATELALANIGAEVKRDQEPVPSLGRKAESNIPVFIPACKTFEDTRLEAKFMAVLISDVRVVKRLREEATFIEVLRADVRDEDCSNFESNVGSTKKLLAIREEGVTARKCDPFILPLGVNLQRLAILTVYYSSIDLWVASICAVCCNYKSNSGVLEYSR
jgi:hypothetical protein